MPFLLEREPRPLSMQALSGIRPADLFVGSGGMALEEAEKADIIHELDDAVAHLHGPSEPQLVHIFETFHEGWDYQDLLDATLKHYRALRGLP